MAPENTVEAFVAAGVLGADGVELDVHRTADGALVVHHDAGARGVGVLAERTEAEIRASRPEIPTLEEALEACAGMLVNIEVKNLPGDADYDPGEGVAGAVVELLVRRGRRDDVLVSSFNLESADRVRELDGAIPTGFLTLVGMDPVDGVDVAHAHGHGAVNPDVRALPRDGGQRLDRERRGRDATACGRRRRRRHHRRPRRRAARVRLPLTVLGSEKRAIRLFCRRERWCRA